MTLSANLAIGDAHRHRLCGCPCSVRWRAAHYPYLLLVYLATAVVACGCNRGRPETHVRPGESAATERANTAVNVRDAGGSTVTPFDQSNARADIELVAAIRSRVVNSDGMSINGRNVKIITNEGRVVLRGPVNSVEERETIVKIAEEIAGATYVTDQLEVDRS
jgi:hyperosmotically inducible periplasmic protein